MAPLGPQVLESEVSVHDVRRYLDEYLMARVGTWTICTSLRYSLNPSIKAGKAPDPQRLLFLSDHDNVFASPEKLAIACEREDGIEPELLVEYLRRVPADNILWLDAMYNASHAERLKDLKRRELRYARIQCDWLRQHRDGSAQFDCYLDRLEIVVSAMEIENSGGPPWGGPSGFQWDPLRDRADWRRGVEFTTPHPLDLPSPYQVSRINLLLGDEE
jgi:hypothetical protein